MAAFSEQRDPPPREGTVTLAELHGRLLTLADNEDPNLDRYQREHGVVYPHVILPETLEPDNSALPRPSAFVTSAKLRDVQSPPQRVVQLARDAASLVALVTAPFSRVPPPPPRTLSPESPMAAIAWHKYRLFVAVAHRTDAVLVYNVSAPSPSPLLLKHAYQKDVRCLAWRPNAGAHLAVGCAEGVLVWSTRLPGGIEAAAKGTGEADDTAAWAQYFTGPHLRAVSALAWSPCGRLLAAGGQVGGGFAVIDVALEANVPLVRHRAGVTALAWSPDGRLFASAGADRVLRVWETQNWTSVAWTGLPSSATVVEWTPDSRSIIFACRGQPHLYCLEVTLRASSVQARLLWSYSLESYEIACDGGDTVCVGGAVRHFALDPTGQRLVVCFDEQRPGSELLAVFSLKNSPLPRLFPMGFLRGPAAHAPGQPPPSPSLVAFASHFSRGALLSAGFTNGKLSFIPLLFVAASLVASQPHALLDGW